MAAIRPRGHERPQWFPRSPAHGGRATRREAGVKLPARNPAFAGSLADRGSAAGRSGDDLRARPPREPAPALVHDVAVLLEAEQQEAHVAPAEADALGELGGGEARLVLQRAGKQADAIEDLHRRGAEQRLRLSRSRRAITSEELRPGSDRASHERYSSPNGPKTMHGRFTRLHLCAYSPTLSTRTAMRTCAR